MKSFREGNNVINYVFLEDHNMEHGCNIARDKTRQFIFINDVINAGILTPSGNRDEIKWKIVINIYKVDLARFSNRFGCA